MTSPAERIEAARKAQAAWAAFTPMERARRMRPLRHAIARRLGEIVRLIADETGKPRHDALTGDVLVTLEHLRLYQRHAPRVLRDRRIPAPLLYFGARFTRVYEPHGVVLIFAPWNYPLQLAAVPMLTALFAGNAVLLKCSERTPRVAALIAELCREAALPEHLVQVSCEPPEQAASLLEARPDLFFFTGSSRAGRLLQQQAAALMIPCVMELGGNDPALVFASCNFKRTVEGLAYGCFSNSGQVCVGVRRIYVEQSIYPQFLPAFLDRIGQLTTADIGHAQPDILSGIQLKSAELVASGATIHTSGLATVITDLPADSVFYREENFGPIVSITPFTGEAEALNLARVSPLALGASVWTGDTQQANRIARALPAGVASINDAIRSLGNPHAPFGGNNASGFGRYHGDEGLLTFSRTRTIMAVGQRRPHEIHWLPFPPFLYDLLRRFLFLLHSKGNPLRRIITALTQKPAKD